MKQWLFILLIGVLCIAQPVTAEIIVLQSGKTIEGDILLLNDDVIMVRDQEGRKFQFPRIEVSQIDTVRPTQDTVSTAPTATHTTSNCALRLNFSGGGLFVPSLRNGGYGAVDIQIGTRHIGQQRIFVGGSVGYQAAIAGATYHFLPLMAVCSMPLAEGTHAPELGVALGYGFAIHNPTRGGMVAQLDMSWRYQYSNTHALLMGVRARWQQAQVSYLEEVAGQIYTSSLGKNLVSLGLHLAVEL